MSLTKSDGNMYPWVTHMHTHIGGECPHRCSYCYTQKGVARLSGKYKGAPRLIEKELDVNYGSGRTIFLEHMTDLFAEGIRRSWVDAVLAHTNQYPCNTYVLQTKNPARALAWYSYLPPSTLLGTTIETNRDRPRISEAPPPSERARKMCELRAEGARLFVTIEPIMDFDPEVLAGWVYDIRPEFVNIGADSKKSCLPEPSAEKVRRFLALLNGIEVRQKSNLERIMGAER